MNQNLNVVRQEALKALAANFIAQGHPAEYAQHMAAAVIFQTDLELRNAQLLRLLGWLQQNDGSIYAKTVALLEETRKEFEQRLQK